jgi:hypothetical protein
MKRRISTITVVIALLFSVIVANAQVTGSGTPGTVPVWTGDGTMLTDSVIQSGPAGLNVSRPLQVSGTATLDGGGGNIAVAGSNGTGLSASGTTNGVVGTSSGGGAGVLGNGGTGVGVSGTSVSNVGVQGIGNSVAGVLGQSNTGSGVSGLSSSGSGVSGTTDSGPGVSGLSNGGPGVRGDSHSASGFGLEGHNDSGIGGAVAGFIDSVNPNGAIAVGGSCTATQGVCTGVVGYVTAPVGQGVVGGFTGQSGVAVHGTATSTSGQANGVVGETSSPDGIGVVGLNQSNGGNGVSGVANGPNATGVNGVNNSMTGPAFGVLGTSFSTGGIGVAGFAAASSGLAIGVNGGTNSAAGIGVVGFNNGGGLAGSFNGGVQINGDLNVTGAKSSLAKLENGQVVALYAVESPENWFEDFGTAQLEKGVATVKLDSLFAQTVNVGMEYLIFLTPTGNCGGLYVAQKTPTTFEVRELRGGKSNIAFDYRIVARRRGFETVRLKEVPANGNIAFK